MTNKRCKDWCDTFASVYPVKSYCSDDCKAAGRSVNEKDKPEAGRTCEPGCRGAGCFDGTCDVCRDVPESEWIGWKREFWSGKLNPAPRPVEPWCANSERSNQPHIDNGTCRPVERCSCEEATRYKAALETIRRRLDAWPVAPAKEIDDIARRALALGEET